MSCCLSLWSWPRTQPLQTQWAGGGSTPSDRGSHFSRAVSRERVPRALEGPTGHTVPHLTPDTGGGADVLEAPWDQPGFCGPRLLSFTTENINQHSLILVFS